MKTEPGEHFKILWTDRMILILSRHLPDNLQKLSRLFPVTKYPPETYRISFKPSRHLHGRVQKTVQSSYHPNLSHFKSSYPMRYDTFLMCLHAHARKALLFQIRKNKNKRRLKIKTIQHICGLIYGEFWLHISINPLVPSLLPVKDESLVLVSVSRLKVPRLSVSSRSRTNFWRLSRLGLISDEKFSDSLVSVLSRLLQFYSVSSRSRPDLDV